MNRVQHLLLASFAATAMIVAVPARAEAPAAGSSSTSAFSPNLQGFSAWGILGWGLGHYGSGVGFGGRYMLPLLSKGLLENSDVELTDRLGLEFGLDFMRHSFNDRSGVNLNQVRPTFGVLWSFWVNESFAFYPKLDLGYEIGWHSGWYDAWGDRPRGHGFEFEVLGGVMYKLGDITLRGELGNIGLKAGVGFGF